MERALKSYLTVAEVADLMQEPNRRKVWRYLRKAGALVALPGFKLRCHVPMSKLREVFPDEYERAVADSRYWEHECTHPRERMQVHGSSTWCSECGALWVHGDWMTPRVRG